MHNEIRYSMEIRTAQNYSEYCQAAELHKHYIPSGFLSSLGSRFLTRLYSFIATDESATLIVAVEEGTVVGFISGTTDLGQLYMRFMLKNVLWGVLLIPRIIGYGTLKKLVETLKYPVKKRNSQLPPAELLSIVVCEEFRGKGISHQLYKQQLLYFKERGIRDFKVVVGMTLSAAVRFYEKMGALKTAETEVHKGYGSWVMIQRIN